MLVKARKSFSLGGGRDVHPGEVFEMPDAAAAQRERRGWVDRVEPAAEPESRGEGAAERAQSRPAEPAHPEAKGPDVATARDPQTSHRDPAPPGEREKGKKGKD